MNHCVHISVWLMGLSSDDKLLPEDLTPFKYVTESGDLLCKLCAGRRESVNLDLDKVAYELHATYEHPVYGKAMAKAGYTPNEPKLAAVAERAVIAELESLIARKDAATA